MVYCGRPSRACRKCRDRNIKCDKKVPSCGQCLRAQHVCPGYHDPRALIIRDQTSSIIQRSHHPSTIPHKQPQKLISDMADENFCTCIPPIILPPLEKRAKGLFIKNHAYNPSSSFSYIRYFEPPKLEHTYFTSGMIAVSLAYLSLHTDAETASDAKRQARKQYGDALRLLNQALRDPVLAIKDETLMTVLLMSYFEKLLSQNRGSAAGEGEGELKSEGMKHLEGAIALVQLRGEEQFQGPAGVELFKHVTQLIRDGRFNSSDEVRKGFSKLSQLEMGIDRLAR